ncbi:Putative transport protein YdiK [Candidatus Ecksteinia adelgidicola]|nr:Putative transport protein YdiK [Candidatus Ecksteinia adelgidicola]
MEHKKHQYDLLRIIFIILFIVVMVSASFLIIQPFILSLTWASMLVITTWPILTKLQNLLWGKRLLAVTIMILLLTLFFMIPIILIIRILIDHSKTILLWINSPNAFQVPDFIILKKIPIIGNTIYNDYNSLFNTGGIEFLKKIQPYLFKTITWFISQIVSISHLLLHCILMLLFSCLLYSRGEKVALAIRYFAIRLSFERGDAVLLLGRQAIRSVALSVIATALIQSILGGLGLVISSIPDATMLGVLIFVCCIVQIGPLLILIPASIWLYWNNNTTFSLVLIIWSIIMTILDNILRLILIRIGADLPILLILLGVIGGVFAFGLIGLFIGPVVLAIAYRLVEVWIEKAPKLSVISKYKK